VTAGVLTIRKAHGMKRNELTILVTGGTGHQGGAAARHLLKDGWKVRALVRDTTKPAAQLLEKAGAHLVVGDLLDRATLDAAVDGCHGVYSMGAPNEVGIEGEVREGFNIADAAWEAGVAHFVYSSVIGADRADGAPFTQGKHRIEHHIGDLGLPATIWRPTSFMDNFLRQKDDILAGRFRSMLQPDELHQYIAVDDIGRFVALAFAEHDRFVGVTREIAGDEMTPLDIAALFSLVLDVPVSYEHTEPPATVMPRMKPPASTEPPRRADIASLRELIPDLVTLEQWVRAQKWSPVTAR
jgi:uncharacterized protein YbjT (DUF2867 family)